MLPWSSLTTLCSKAWSARVSVANHSWSYCGTSVFIKWKCAVGRNGKFWNWHQVNWVLANDLGACATVLLSRNNFALIEKLILPRFNLCVKVCIFACTKNVPHPSNWWVVSMAENNDQLGITGLVDQIVVVLGESETCDSPWITAKSLYGNDNNYWLQYWFGGSWQEGSCL